MAIRAVVADIDGTLITRGDPNSCPDELVEVVHRFRGRGGRFSLITGRDLDFSKLLRRRMRVMPYLKGEVSIFEDVGIELSDGTLYDMGGMIPEEIEEVKVLEEEHPEIFRGLEPLIGSNFTIRTTWVTEEFNRGEETNKQTLARAYPQIQALVGERFPNVHIGRSADAIDVVAKGADKKVALEEYLGILKREYGVEPSQVLGIGDARNDEGLLKYLVEVGGHAAFVGAGGELRERLGEAGVNLSHRPGPEGTAEILRRIA